MYYQSIINESKAGDISNITKSSTHMYSHLMKFVTIRPILPGWVGTIKNQIKELQKITNASSWRDVTDNPAKLTKIKNDAIAEYEDNNKDNIYRDKGEIAFNIIYNDIYDITKFKDKEFIKNYLISKLDLKKDKDLIDYIKKELS